MAIIKRGRDPRHGRLIASTWRPRAHQPLFEALGQIAEKHLGPGNDKRWSLDADELRV